MLAPDYLDHAPDRLVLLWQQVEDDILRDVARRISKMETLTPTANWQLWRYQQTEAVRQDVVKKLARYTGKSETEIRRLMQEAATRALEAEDEIYYHYGKEPTPFAENATLQALLNAGYAQTAGTFRNLTGTTANTVSGQFEAALDRAHLKVSTGAFDYKSAVKSAVDGLADTMKYVTYPTGHTDTLEVACRRAVLTGVNQTAGKLQVARADEMGVEFFETTAHGGARPTHAEWQGRQFHRGGAVDYLGKHYPDFESATGYGTGAGLCGWNCRHTFFAVFPELGAPPAWTREQLEQLNAQDIEYNGQKYTRYEISQMQRAKERAVRKYKRRYLAEDAAGADTTQSAVKLKAAREDLAAFTRATNSRMDSARTSVAGFGRSESSKATWAARNRNNDNSSGQYYRPVVRGKAETFAYNSAITLNVQRVDNYEGSVYVSDSVKRRAVDVITKNTDAAVKRWGISHTPTVVIVSEKEAPGILGKYDAITDIVYYTPSIAERKGASTAGGRGAVEFHEIWHMKQAEVFRKKGWVITRENHNAYLKALRAECKKNIDALGITEYNVGNLSDYAKLQFGLGHFDEVEAEFMALRRRK